MKTGKEDSYLPIAWDFREVLEEDMKQGKTGAIHYFSIPPMVEKAEGAIKEIIKNPDGEFLISSSNDQIRLDKIITLFGQPGPAYEQYDSYANACLSCFQPE